MKKVVLTLFCSLSFFTLVAQNSLVNGWDSVSVILPRIVPPIFSTSFTTIYNIKDYGAVADSSTLCTTAINNAISTCSLLGGGTVIVPAGGTFLTGGIRLKSNVNLHISKGARLKFSTNPTDYLPLVLTRFEGVECYNYAPFIYAYGQQNIAITGSGTLDGNASSINWWAWKNTGDTDRTALLSLGENGVPVSSRTFGPNHKLRPVFIQPYACTKVLIDSVTILRSPMWEINPVLCENVTISNVTINSHGPNNDGCDPECSKNVLIKNCIFDTGDDCIAIKSGRNNDGRRVNVSSENIVIQNCTMKDGNGGVVIGSEISGNVRNVYVENCTMNSPNLDRALRIKTNSVRGGIIENIFLRNIQVPQVASSYIEVDMNYEEGDAGSFTPIVRNIVIDNMTGDSSPQVFNINCYERSPISNLILKNCTLTATSLGNYINVRKLQIINTTVNNNIPLLPTAISNYKHAELYSSKNNWGWSNVYSGFTGNGYMEPVDSNNSLEFEFSRTGSEQDSVVFTYANPSTLPKAFLLYVNGVVQTTLSFPPTTDWSTQKVYIILKAGTNNLKLTEAGGDGEIYLDNLAVSYSGASIPLKSTETVVEDYNLTIFPNPVTASSQIKFSLVKAVPVTFTIFDSMGKHINEWTITNAHVGKNLIPLNKELKNGLYILEMSSLNCVSQIKFMVK